LLPRAAAAVLLWAAASVASNGCSPSSSADDPVTVIRGNEADDAASAGAGGSGPPPMVNETGDDALYAAPPPPDCADFHLDPDEACDDGNRDDGDGCSGNCRVVEPGYSCVPGEQCIQQEVCGDSLLELNETCDDGNDVGKDGCSANCRIESGYACPSLGKACVSTAVCGDGFIALGEGCDDTNKTAGDGCSATCQIEAGWGCPIPGAKCQPQCGDGQIVGTETCDDGNVDPGDGCSTTCRLEAGFACDAAGVDCRRTVCQDGVKEGSEQCDDENDVPYDGCTAACTNEPRCASPVAGGVYTCTAVCGDGMKFLDEECDDGNTLPDDGCSPTCQREDGYACTEQIADFGDALELPIIYRDFTPAHPQFEIDPRTSPRLPGMVQNQLACRNVGAGAGAHVECKPAVNPAFRFDPDGGGPAVARAWTLDGSKPAADSQAPQLNAAAIATAFNQWFTDSNQSVRVIGTLPLALQPDGSFQFSASQLSIPPAQFFPLDARGPDGTDARGIAHNFHFTSEVRQWFETTPEGELLQFTGDDDVWVFVNGQLTVDLGGIHSEIRGSIELSEDGQNSTLIVQDVAGGAFATSTIDVPISRNSVNEIVVFQAERHVTESNYTLTLRGFNAPVTTCRSVCGDSVVTPDESCDDGPLNGTGYDRCSANCTPGPRCGDGITNGPEACDNGFNQDPYEKTPGSCAPGCVRASHCGDAVVDANFGEQCDDGVNDGSYGGCTAECLFGPRCGDTFINGNETCDDGNRRNGDDCNVNCQRERNPI
jgi:fibro-slime domain-containing protein